MRAGRFLSAVAIFALAVPGTAGADATVHDIADGFAGPLQIAVDAEGLLYVAQSFSATLTVLDTHGARTDIAHAPGEVGGVAALGNGAVAYTTDERSPGAPAATLVRQKRSGDRKVIADLLRYEQNHNPDGPAHYGFRRISRDCAAQLPADLGPPSYSGLIDSHAYAVASNDDGYFIADAGGNDILHVGKNGGVSTVAVLPSQPVALSAEAVANTGLPDCTVGLIYDFESVPTDVEIGPGGTLYVSTLPGGPEGPELGARGSVYKVDPRTGVAIKLAGGLAGAVNVALGADGTVYAAELFGGRVVAIRGGRLRTVAMLPTPAALEYANGKLYVAYNVFANGTVATIAV